MLMGGLLGVAVTMLAPRPAMIVCRDAPPTFASILQSRYACSEMASPDACASVPGCRVTALCRAPVGYADDRDRCGGLTRAETIKPNEKAPAVMPRSQPNSSTIGGKNSEKAVRALTPIAMVTNVTTTMTQP